MGRFSIFKHKSLVESYLRLEAENSDMQKQLDKANSDLSHLKSDNAGKLIENTELTQKVQVMEETLHKFSPLLNLDYLKTERQSELQQDIWNAWKIVDNKDTTSRKQRACEYILTPLSLDAKRGCAVFMGQSVSKYRTSLRECECQDFARRLKPCKHMYRLAHELGVEELENEVLYVDEPSKLVSVKNFKNIILPSLSSSDMNILSTLRYTYCCIGAPSTFKNLFRFNLVQVCPEKNFLLNSINRDELFSLLSSDDKFRKNSKKEDLVQHIIECYPDKISEIEKLNVAVCISPYALHLTEYFSTGK